MPAIDLGPALDLLLKFVPSIVNAASALITTIKRKRPAAEIAGEASDMLGDVAAVVLPTLPYPDGHPARETVELLPDVLAVVADGKVTRAEALAMGQRLLDTGADMLAWAGSLPEGDDEDEEEPRVAVKVAAAVKRQGRKAARRHLRPASKPPRPIAPSALVGSRPKPPTLPPALPSALPPHSSPFGRPFDAVFGDAAGRPPIPGRDNVPGNMTPAEKAALAAAAARPDEARPRPPGGTLPEPPVDTRPPRVEIDDDTADVPPVVEAPPVVEVPPPAAEPRPLAGLLRVARMVHFDGLDRPGCDVAALCAAMLERDAALRATGTPELWALTGPQVELLEFTRPGMLSGLRPGFLAAREPHGGQGTALDALVALNRAGVMPSPVLGSAVDPADYVGGPWSVVVTGAEPGHIHDTKESGFRVIAPGFVACQSAATASSSQKSKVARKVADGSLPWGVEGMSISAMDPQTGGPHVAADGSRHYFGTPKTKDRDDHPDVASVPAETAWANMMEGAGGAADRILLTTFDEAAAAAVRAGVLDATGSALYPSDKS